MDRQTIIFALVYDKMTDVAISAELPLGAAARQTFSAKPPFFSSSQTDIHPEWNYGALEFGTAVPSRET